MNLLLIIARVKSLFHLALGASLLCAAPLAFSLAPKPALAAESAAQKAGRAAIAAQYRRGDIAVVKHDVATLVSIMAPDYRGYDPDGSVADRAQAEASLRVTMSGQINGVALKFTKSETKILSLKWRGPDAIVMAQTTMVGIGSKGNRSVRVEVVGLSRDYWGKTARGWQTRQSVTTQMKRWINGVRDPSM